VAKTPYLKDSDGGGWKEDSFDNYDYFDRIDQGGCFETSKPTTHAEPTYVIDGVVHYCVANMPGAVARTSTEALVAATLPYINKLASMGLKALEGDKGLAQGLSIQAGEIMCPEVKALFNQ
jgi:alanine dehydrogenase